MEKYNITDDIKAFGLQVKTFPSGIGEAFDELIKKTGNAAGERNYYGISEFQDGRMYYYAAAEEKAVSEAQKFNYETFTIEKGAYLAGTLPEWRKKTECIKDIFSEIIKDPDVDKTKPAIEWYKDDKEMMCLVKMKE
jgi:predicted transcriptional regulator YdeE